MTTKILFILLVLCADESLSQEILTRVDSISHDSYWVEQGNAIPFSPSTSLAFSFPDSSMVYVEVQRCEETDLQENKCDAMLLPSWSDKSSY